MIKKTKNPTIHRLGYAATWLFAASSSTFVTDVANAGVSVGLSGSGSQNNAGLESYQTSSGTVSLSMNLGEYIRVGANHRRAFEHRKGLKANGDTYYRFKNDLDSSIYSLNLTLVLYNGLVSPYIFGGIANKYYTNKFTYDFDQPIVHTSKFSLTEVPTYGFGVAIFLNRSFSLKISQTYSPGKVIDIDPQGNETEDKALDSYTQVGISYNI